MALKTETCWGCGATERYDNEKQRRPFYWHEKQIAGGVYTLCQICCGLLNVQGRVSHILISKIEVRHGIKLNKNGGLIE